MSIDRRGLIKSTSLIGLVGFAGKALACDETPDQIVGPYYPERSRTWEDEDLTRRRGATADAQGTLLTVRGVVRGGDDCGPLANAKVEIWQADRNGRYNHSGDTSTTPLDRNFQYFGRMYTDAQGRYGFKTIRPGKYPGRTPHIHFRVVAEDGTELITQLYFSAEARNNARDGVYRDLVNRQVEDLVTVDWTADAQGQLSAAFDIVLSGAERFTPHVD